MLENGMLGEQRWNQARCLHTACHDSEISLQLLLGTFARFSNSPGQSVLGYLAVTRLNKHHHFTFLLPESALISMSPLTLSSRRMQDRDRAITILEEPEKHAT